MRIMCLSDTHGGSPMIPIAPWDAIVHGGDFYNRLRKNDPIRQSKVLQDWIKEQSASIYAVHGNHDVKDEDGLWKKAIDPTGTCVSLGDEAWLFGVGWHGEVFFETPTENDLRKVCDSCVRAHRMKALEKRPVILLTHYPPDYIPYDGNARGFLYECVSELVAYLDPTLVICGHLHQNGPKYRMDGHRMTLFPSRQGIGVQLLGDAIQLV